LGGECCVFFFWSDSFLIHTWTNAHLPLQDTPVALTTGTDKFDEVYTPRMPCKDGGPAMLSPSERSLAMPNQQKQTAATSAKRTVAARTRAILEALPIKHTPKPPRFGGTVAELR
jgi:hypothetical protein